MNKHQSFFIDNIEKHTLENFEKAEKELKKVFRVYKDNEDRLMQEVANVLLKYNIKEEHLALSDIEKKKLKDSFTKSIVPLVSEEQKLSKETIENLLFNYAKDQYLYNSFLYSIGIDYKLKMVSDKVLKKIINTKVEGEIWSSRLWTNKNQLQKLLRKEIFTFLDGKTSVNDIYRKLESLYTRNRYETKRLTETELARVMQQANEEFGKGLNVQWQLYSATLDKKTSKICRGYDGKKFRFDNTNKPIPPLHPNCRSTLINIPSEDYIPRTRYDNESKEIIPYQNYDDWKKDKGLE